MILWQYFAFVLAFAVGPRAALHPYSGRHALAPALAIYALLGSALGSAIMTLAWRARWLDRERLERFCGPYLARVSAGRWTWIVWPTVCAVSVVAVTSVVHGFAAGWHAVRTVLGTSLLNESLGGTWSDSVNALLAANALLSPVFALITVGSQQFDERYESAWAAPIVFALFGYSALALSAAHPGTGFWDALAVLFAPLSVPLMFIVSAGWILRTLNGFITTIRHQR